MTGHRIVADDPIPDKTPGRANPAFFLWKPDGTGPARTSPVSYYGCGGGYYDYYGGPNVVIGGGEWGGGWNGGGWHGHGHFHGHR
jgi:hypothetical protein